MGDLLSQEEIDALMGLGSTSEPENNENIEKFTSIFSESAQSTLSTLLSKEVLLGTTEILTKTRDEIVAENAGNYVVSQIVLDDAVQGLFLLILKQDEASIVVDLILMGEGVAKPDFTADDEDGFTEAINQILGAFGISLKENFANITVKQSGVFPLELSDASCPIQSLDDQSWKVANIPFKIEGIIDSTLILMMPDVTAKHFDELSFEKEEVEETAPIAPKSETPPTQQVSQEPPGEARNIDILLDVELPISVRVGETEMTLQDILKLGSGSIVELNKSAGSTLDLMVNNKRIARGEVVVVDANFALRLTEIESPTELIKKLK